MKQISLLVFAPLLFSSFSAHAIRGDYLPESELPHNVCRIMIGTMRHTLQPSFKNGTPRKDLKPVIIENKDHFVCSSNLVAPDTILTAAHCFQGNNEWKVRKGSFKYPKLDEKGERPKGCEGVAYMDKPECIDGYVFGTLTVKWLNVRVECPKEDGSGMESRALDEALGYSNPFYTGNASENKHNVSISVANFDFAFYKLRNPITNIKPMEVEWNFENLEKAFKLSETERPNPFGDRDLCRSFGYGLYNEKTGDGPREEKAGVLHGANTPPARMDPGFIETLVDARTPMIGIGWVDHGDSGGALMCRGRNDRNYKLFGIVSRGINRSDIEKAFEGQEMLPSMNMEDMEDMMNVISRSDYSLPSYNRRFFDYTIKNGSFPRPLDGRYWWELFAPYEKQQIEGEYAQTNSCIQNSRHEMTRSTFNMYKKAFKDLENALAKANQEASSYGPYDAGLFLTKLHEFKVLEKNRQLFWDCRNKSFFRDP